ncbi:MAG TPA: hypothetical protein VLJ86_17175 [Ramlibacter sp.]|nr:hypothetical protein [Ramlibacter sp.]
MHELQPQLDRIEHMLSEGNSLRREALELQRQAIATQQSLMEQQKTNLARAAQVNDQALALQQRARRVVTWIIPILIVLVAYVSWLLFFRPYL